jgi:hypothetical protein
MNNSGIILTLAYPETIVMVSEEWFSPFLRYGMAARETKNVESRFNAITPL